MLTPYQYAHNTPIVAIDLDGLEGLPTNEAMKAGLDTQQPAENQEVHWKHEESSLLSKGLDAITDAMGYVWSPFAQLFNAASNKSKNVIADGVQSVLPSSTAAQPYSSSVNTSTSSESDVYQNLSGEAQAAYNIIPEVIATTIVDYIAPMAGASSVTRPITSPVNASVVAQASKLTRAATSTTKNIAFGLNTELNSFAKKFNFKTYRQFTSGGIKPTEIEAAILNPSNNLHFNLDGMSGFRYNSFTPGSKVTLGNITNWELHTIVNNPNALSRTTFYKNGSEVSLPYWVK
jgi:hypothetical protein